MKEIHLELLRGFVAYAEAGNMREAADRLGLTQPTLSLQLQRLEEAMPEPLFLLAGRKKVLSRYGHALLEIVRPRLSDLQHSVMSLEREYGDESKAVLRIGLRVEVLDRVVNLLSFKTRVEFHYLRRDEIVERLLSHDLDIGIMRDKPDSPLLIARKLFEDAAKLIVHRSLLPKGLSIEEASRDRGFLSQTPLLAYNKSLPYVKEWFEHCGVDSGQIVPRILCEDWRSVRRCAELGLGYALIPDALECGAELVEAPIPTRIVPPSQFNMIFHVGLKKSRLITSALKT